MLFSGRRELFLTLFIFARNKEDTVVLDIILRGSTKETDSNALLQHIILGRTTLLKTRKYHGRLNQ